MPLHPHLIRRHETQPQVIPQPLQHLYLRTAQVDERHNIAIRHRRTRFVVVVIDRGVPAATLDPVQIIAAAPHQRVVATTTDQGVVSLIATQPVVATATLQIVVAAVALQHVIAGATQQPITKPTSHQGVVPCQSIDPIHHVAVAAQTVGASRGAAHHQPRLLLLSAPHHPIAEPEALDP